MSGIFVPAFSLQAVKFFEQRIPVLAKPVEVLFPTLDTAWNIAHLTDVGWKVADRGADFRASDRCAAKWGKAEDFGKL
jgi:hypothetical protein